MQWPQRHPLPDDIDYGRRSLAESARSSGMIAPPARSGDDHRRDAAGGGERRVLPSRGPGQCRRPMFFLYRSHPMATTTASAATDIRANVIAALGDTPLVRLNAVTRGIRTPVAAKLEMINPGGSVKDRIGIRMIEEAERKGWLRPGGTIVEPTSGNTGVGLAMAAAVQGLLTASSSCRTRLRRKRSRSCAPTAPKS